MSTLPARNRDDLSLLKTVRLLSSTPIRNGLDSEIVKGWLLQFDDGPEKTLALLVLRNLIFRTKLQIEAGLEQALRRAALHFCPPSCDRKSNHWRDILKTESDCRSFSFAPLSNTFTPPGSSGQLVMRSIKNTFEIPQSRFRNIDQIGVLAPGEILLIADDAAFTAESLETTLTTLGFSAEQQKCVGVVVALAHERSLKTFNDSHPNVSIFFGEKITEESSLESLSKNWIASGYWNYADRTPIETYYQIVTNKAAFASQTNYGFGGMELPIAYEHGIPDNALRLLWDESSTWKPLIRR
jgi:hypothetical protein